MSADPSFGIGNNNPNVSQFYSDEGQTSSTNVFDFIGDKIKELGQRFQVVRQEFNRGVKMSETAVKVVSIVTMLILPTWLMLFGVAATALYAIYDPETLVKNRRVTNPVCSSVALYAAIQSVWNGALASNVANTVCYLIIAGCAHNLPNYLAAQQMQAQQAQKEQAAQQV